MLSDFVDFVLSIRTDLAPKQLCGVVMLVFGQRRAGYNNAAGQREDGATIKDCHSHSPM
jgi:hypothetical protein